MSDSDINMLRGLYPELSEEQLEEAHETLTRYAALLVRMVKRCHNERKECNRGSEVN